MMRNTNPTLLTLLKSGCNIEFANGYRLRGDPETGYIECANVFRADGLWILDRNGVKEALRDVREWGRGVKQ